MKRDIITKVQTTYTPDGSGGYTEETVELGSYEVKLSISNNVEEATAYGVSIEQVLKVIADVPLLEDEAGLNMIIGQQGIQGEPGPKGDTGATGPQGEPGYTPIKGVDYFTEADVQAIVQQVLNSLPQAEGGLF